MDDLRLPNIPRQQEPSHQGLTPSEISPRSPRSPEIDVFLKKNIDYTNLHLEKNQVRKLRSVKAVILVVDPKNSSKEPQVLLQIKKAAGGVKSKKDRKLEFAGGTIEVTDKDVAKALHKELVEEDKTGILAKRFTQALETRVAYCRFAESGNQKHLIYIFTVTTTDAKKIAKGNFSPTPHIKGRADHGDEVYGYVTHSPGDLRSHDVDNLTKRTRDFVKQVFKKAERPQSQ